MEVTRTGLHFEKPLAIVDVETTGTSPQYARILEIAIIRIEQGKIIEKFSTVVDPETSIPNTITSITGISEKDIRNAPTFNDIFPDVSRLLDGAIFVAHNAMFDYGFIKNEYKRLGKLFVAKRLCTVTLSRKLFSQYRRHDLSSIIERCDFICENRHRALDDAQILVDFLAYAHAKVGEEKFRTGVQLILQRNSVPSAVSSKIIDALPELPGVYVFYGEHDELLYIGKSINIKKRVISHFSGDGSSKSVKLAHTVHDIEAVPTHGELGALLLESEKIKSEQPLYNRMLRHARKLIAAQEYIDKEGYKRIRLIEYSVSDDEFDHHAVVGIFRSNMQAKKALQHFAEGFSLCQKLLGLENGSRCFAFQLGKCAGACAGREDSNTYNLKFDKAFAHMRVKSWPFSGPIKIHEKSSEEKYTGTVFIIDDWKLLESFTYDEEGNKQKFLQTEIRGFDYDAYKILARYILTHPQNTQSLI